MGCSVRVLDTKGSILLNPWKGFVRCFFNLTVTIISIHAMISVEEVRKVATLENITISFCEPNGDGIMSYNINGAISAMIPNVGDKVHVEADGRYREVSEKAFMFLENTKAIVVQIYLKE